MTSKVAKKTAAKKSSKAAKKKADPKPGQTTKLVNPGLFPGEEVKLENIGEKKRRATDEELNSRYVTGEVRIVTESARYSLAGIRTMLGDTVGSEERLRYDLDPEYQRRHRWSKERKSRLIESFLMNIPVPPIFLYERDYAQFEVMDGRQRLTALAEFYRNEFALEGLQYWEDLNGCTYQKLPSKVRDGIDRRYISSIILLKETARNEEQAAQLKKLVFERLNSGGVALRAPKNTAGRTGWAGAGTPCATHVAWRGILSTTACGKCSRGSFRSMIPAPWVDVHARPTGRPLRASCSSCAPACRGRTCRRSSAARG